jgi:hypothetical protein
MDNQHELAVEPRKMGRPATISLDPAIKEEILGYIAEGAYIQTAFRAAGISDENYYRWCDKAEQGVGIFVEFMRALKIAEAQAEISVSRDMLKGKDRFLPAATFLERRFRDRWGRSDRHQIDATVSIRVEQVDYTKLAKQVRTKTIK